MTEGSALGAVERLVLLTAGPGCGTVEALAERLGHRRETVEEAVVRLLSSGLVEAADDGLVLTAEGRRVEVEVQGEWESPAQRPAEPPPAPRSPDLDDVVRSVGTGVGAAVSAWSAERRRRSAAEQADDRARLVSDAERDGAVHVLADAFSHGRLSADELEQRTGRALAARTHGELDAVLHGLGGLRLAVPNHPGRKVVFWAVTVPVSPFLLFGGLLLAGGSDLDDRLVGLFLVALALPLVLKLRRWAWPRAH